MFAYFKNVSGIFSGGTVRIAPRLAQLMFDIEGG